MAEEDGEGKKADEGEAVPKKKMPLILVAVGLQLLVVLVAGGLITKTVLFSQRPDVSEGTLRERAIASVRDDTTELATLPLDEFSITLPMRHNLKTTLQIEVSNEKTAKLLKGRMAAVRARVLNVLSTQNAEKTSSLQGKLSLKDSIREAINEELLSNGENKGVVREVYFVEFVLI